MVTVWSKRAQTELQKIYLFIQQGSFQNAEIVRDDIIDVAIDLYKHPEKHRFPSLRHIITYHHNWQ